MAPIKQLTTFQRVIFGVANNFCGSVVGLVEGVVMFYYNDKKGVSTGYIGLANFVVGVLAAYTALLVGNASDRAKGKYRRKPYVAVFAPLFAVGAFFRFGAFTSEAGAPAYYAITYAVQTVGLIGLRVAQEAWAVELVEEGLERSKLYAMATLLGIVGIGLGLALTAVPLAIAGLVSAVLIIASNVCLLFFLPDRTVMHKRTFIPTIANISSVLWNQQFLIVLSLLMCIWFINTIPSLFMFFLRFAVDLSQDDAETYYAVCIAAFVVTGLLSLPFVSKSIAYKGKLFVLRSTLLCVVVAGVLLFLATYINVILVVLIFGLVGGGTTIANVVLSIITADCVTYDELLTGKKRGSSYQGILKPPNMLIQIAGSSIPLALMSLLGFDHSTNEDDDDTESTPEATLVLRMWCTLVVGFLIGLGYLVLRTYQLDEATCEAVIENIQKREVPNADTIHGLDERDSIESPLAGAEVKAKSPMPEDSEEAEIIEEDNARVRLLPLDSVLDPTTGKAVAPAPYAKAQYCIDGMLSDNTYKGELSPTDILKLRSIAYYFPVTLHLCAESKSRMSLLYLAAWRTIVYFALLVLGIWQSVVTLYRGDEFGSYLIVVLTTIYSFFLSYHLLHAKAYYILYHMNKMTESSVALIRAVEMLGERLQSKDATEPATTPIVVGSPREQPLLDRAKGDDIYNKTIGQIVSDDAVKSTVLIASFIGSYFVLNY